MYGAAVGDIIGSIYEHHNIKTKDFPLFGEGCRFTDDTSMTCAVTNALRVYASLRDAGRPAVEAYKKELQAQMRYYVRTYTHGYGKLFEQWALTDNPEPLNIGYNGAAMRVSTVAYFTRTLSECDLLAGLSAVASHNNPEAVRGARAVACAGFLALQGNSMESIRREVEERYYYDLGFTLDSIRADYKFELSCQGAVPPAIVAFLESTGFEDAVRNAISIGGDSDTLAAIAGGLAGVKYGVPSDILAKALTFLPEEITNCLRMPAGNILE